MMHENEISLHEDETFAPKPFIDENSMHEIVYCPISNGYF